jgi:predicted short-subunit dehydrogenase-like oxidoreductase (DUF2520 family)
MISVTIIGVGRVGGALALSLPPDTYTIQALVFRGDSNSDNIASQVSPRPMTSAIDELYLITSDVIFITTQDAHIASTAKALAGKISGSPIVFHTSGSYASSILDELKEIGCQTGSVHPLVSISKADMGPTRFPGAFFCVEGTPEAVETGKQIINDLGGRPFSIETKFKTLYHAAAVTACGHLVALFDASVEMMTKCGLSADEAKNILMPLVTSTVQNLSEQSTAAALTGTFARADIETFTRHLTALNENVSDDLLEIYLLLGERSLELAAKQGVSPARIDTLRTKVSIAKSKLKW